MNRSTIITAFFALVFLAGQCALAQSGYNLFQKGLIQERVKGDLDEAIKVYERIIVKFPNNRPIVAKALLHIGLCYEKMGKQEAQKAYQRLIEEYTDQHEPVAQARARLLKLGYATEQNPSAMSTRQVWAPALDTMGTPSPDGRHLSYVNWTKGNLAVHDLETGENRDLTNEGTWETPSQFCDVSIWSPDSSQIAYCWIDKGKGTDLRIVGLDGSEPRVLHSDPESGYAWPRAWSHDGKHILAIFCNRDAAKETGHIDKIALVSVADGSLRILKSLGNRRSRFMNFSPDDRYVVFDLETKEGSGTHDIHLLAIDGSQETPLVEHPANDGAPFWTPDGKRIVFVSDRSGSMGVWMLDVDDGSPKGTPSQVKEMGTHFGPMGFTRDGSLYYWLGTPAVDVYVATLDFEAGKVLAPPTKRSLRFEGSNFAPFWSPDGKYLAYASRRSALETYLLVIRSIESGQERDLSPKSLRMRGAHAQAAPRWSPDGRSILVAGEAEGVRGLHLVDVQKGDFTTIVQNELRTATSAPRWPVFSKDGKQIYYVRDRSWLIIWKLAG